MERVSSPHQDEEQQPVSTISWEEAGGTREALWRSAAGVPAPRRLRAADDTLSADAAFRLACEGTALLWLGDFQNAKQLLQAMARRFDERQRRSRKAGPAQQTSVETFHRYRLMQAQRARTLGMLLIPVQAGHVITLRRAPDVRAACDEVYGPVDTPYVISLRELQGLIGAHEWRRTGVVVPELGERIHAHFGVFSPVRGEYVALVAEAPLPQALRADSRAFDIGTGTGVLAAVLAKRGVRRVVATDADDRALACARENITRLGFDRYVDIQHADLYPAGRAPLIVCNPPWLPGRPASPIEHAIYDHDQRMLRGYLSGLPAHLMPGGEGWLILSDLAEHIGLRSRDALLQLFAQTGLKVLERIDVKPTHPRSRDADDPLFAARAAEVTSLWRLAVST